MSADVKRVGEVRFQCSEYGTEVQAYGYDDGDLELRISTDAGLERIVIAESDVDELRVLLLRVTLAQGRKDRS